MDTTGCGDAFSAGFLCGLALRRERPDAAVLGCPAAALVAQGLGTDHGDFDLAAVEQMAARVVRCQALGPQPNGPCPSTSSPGRQPASQTRLAAS